MSGLSMQLNGEGTLCNVTLTAPRPMAAPVFLYYELDNFYQNHRRCALQRERQLLFYYSCQS